MLNRFYFYFHSPLGELELSSNGDFLLSCNFVELAGKSKTKHEHSPSRLFTKTQKQLDDYFEGKLTQFDLPLELEGTDFQKRVWIQLTSIAFGKTISYLTLAKHLGDINCIRAAASANGKNPFAIIVPCHRVIGSDGSLTGYSGELWRKQWLLETEAKYSGTYEKLF